ncbi:hypothetical protein QJQ45_027257 [Haematococcus lacustris]|nr:hypothetical protein QJQ45_027257 [Haematococcus lacustris]
MVSLPCLLCRFPCFVVYYALECAAWRADFKLTVRCAQPVGRAIMFGKAGSGKALSKVQEERVRKWNESCWKLTIYILFTSIAIGISIGEPWFWDTRYFWVGCSHFPPCNLLVTPGMLLFYCMQTGFYVQAIHYLIFHEIRRKDWLESLVHHIATSVLLAYSYYVNFSRVGVMILLVHDMSDIFLEAAKLARQVGRYARRQGIATTFFVVFASVWIYTRNYVFPAILIRSTLLETLWYADLHGIKVEPHYTIFNALLLLLELLHIYWTYLILKEHVSGAFPCAPGAYALLMFPTSVAVAFRAELLGVGCGVVVAFTAGSLPRIWQGRSLGTFGKGRRSRMMMISGLQRGRCVIAGAVREVAVSLSPILPNPVLLELEDAAVESLLRWLSGVEGPDAAGSPTTLVAVVVQPCSSSTLASPSHPLDPSTPSGMPDGDDDSGLAAAPSPEPCAVPSSGVEVAVPRPDPGSHEGAAPLLAMHWGVTAAPGGPWEAPPPGWFTWPDASEDAGGQQLAEEEELLDEFGLDQFDSTSTPVDELNAQIATLQAQLVAAQANNQQAGSLQFLEFVGEDLTTDADAARAKLLDSTHLRMTNGVALSAYITDFRNTLTLAGKDCMTDSMLVNVFQRGLSADLRGPVAKDLRALVAPTLDEAIKAAITNHKALVAAAGSGVHPASRRPVAAVHQVAQVQRGLQNLARFPGPPPGRPAAPSADSEGPPPASGYCYHCGLSSHWTKHCKRKASGMSKEEAMKDAGTWELMQDLKKGGSAPYKAAKRDRSPDRGGDHAGPSRQYQGRRPQTARMEANGMALNALLDEYADVFAPITSLPPERPVGHAIPLVPDARPSVVPQYRMSQDEHAELKKQVQDLLAKGMIEPSSCPFAAPILFVKKKSGELRMCLDYRQLNKITIRDQYPLPRIDDLFIKLSGCTVFSSLDLQAGYNQIRITPEDVPKTAFRTPDGHYQFKVLSFGLCNAPATFQRVMNDAFAPVLNQCALVYLDDILVMSKSVDEHLKHLRKVFDLLRLNKLFAKQSKCEFMRTTLKFLGHVIFAGAIAVDPEKIKSISSWPVPQSLQQLQSFLGAANFVRKFVHNFSVLAAPLTDLCGKAGDSFLWHNWPADELKAFASLKAAVAQVPMLRLPDHTQPFQVYCDASLQGVGAVLMQDGYPLAYLSKKLSSAERNYTTGEQELLALITACKEWRCYLEGVPFTLFTDHKPLTALPTQKVLSRRQARWMEFLSRFTFDLQYLPGDANPADPLSRIPAGPQDCAMVCVVTTRRQAKQSLERGEVRVAQALPQVPPVGTPSNAPTAVDALAPRPTVSDNPVAAHHSRLPELEAPSAADTSVHYPAAPAHPLELADHLVHGYRLDPAFTAEADLSGMYMDDHGLWRRTGKGTVMVPNDPELREYILHEMHDAAYAGHVGITKTLERLSRVFYWDTMRADVRHYVTTCDACQRDKSSTLKPGGLLNPLSIPDYRWESVSMDLITKLPSASHGFDAICVFVDRLSKMVHFVPCKESMNAKGFARLFVDNVFKLHGLPKDMVSDRGPHFHNTFWHHVQKLLGMRVSLSSSYHPQSDGQTERYNRVLEEMLRHYISPTQADWPDYLSLAEFAVNNSWQESIKSTPFLVNTGQSPITPMLHSLPDKGRCPEGLSYATWWQEAVAKAKLCMQAAQQRQAAYANQDRRDVHYKVGQMVLLSTKNMRLKPGKARKLLPRFVGPFKVLDLVGQVAVNLQLPASMSRLHPVFHVSLIKPYTGTDVGFMPPPVEWLDEEPVYYVERLLDHRHVHAGKAKEYLVQWEGYDADHNTWEPRSNLVGCDKILAEYNAAHNLKQCESRGFTRGGTEAPLEGEECKVRTSGRDCRFASSGLSRECEPSRDAGYTCSVRFGRLKTSDIAFVKTTGGQQLAEEEELLDEFGLDQFDSTSTPVDELNAQIATLQAQLVAAQANNQQAGSLQFLEFVGEDLTTDADAARAKLLDSTHLRMTNGVALSAYITDFKNTLTLAGKDCMTDSMLVNVFQRGLSADLRGPVAKDLRALVAPTLDEAIKAAITNHKALVAAAGSGVHPASRRPVAAVHQVAQVQRGLQNLARFPGPPPGRPAAPSADSEGPPPASGYCYHCGLSSHWTKHCKRKASGMSKEEAMKDAGTWELMQDLKKGGSAPYKAAKRDRSPDRGGDHAGPSRQYQGRRPQTARMEANGMALNALLDEYADVFAPITSLPPERPVGHAIPLVPDARPSVVPQYRMSQDEHAELKKQVQDLLAKGMIEPSSCPFAAPILFVKKKSGELRMCLDYRQLNKITIRDQYPLPRIDDLFIKLSGCTVFSSLDLQAGYNQIRITPEDVPKTALRTPDGHYQFKVLSFGLCNAPATFQRVMNDAFAPVLNQCALVYLDDILVMSKSVDEHLKHLRKVFDLLRLNKLFAKQSKCEFMRTTLKFLGHVIFAGAIAVDPEKIKSISSWPVPQSLQQLQSFLGAANFVRKFVHNFSVLAAPLTDLCGKAGDSFLWHNWPADELKAFASLKAAVAQVPMLRLPDHTQPFQVYCDASLQGVGAVLMQDGYPLAYLSKKLSSAERNYTTGEQELLALITACKEWRCYLEGVPFTLFTDHKPLTALPTQKVLSRRQARWMEFLSRFTFDLQYLPGDANPADPLSRIPAGPQDCAMVCVVTTRRQAKQSLERGEVRVAQALPQVPPVGTPSNAPTAVDALAPRPTVSDNPVAAHHSRLPELEAPSAADTSVHYPAAPAHPLELADHLVHGYRLDPAFTAEADLSGMYMDDHGLWRRTGKGTVMVPNDPELREYILHEMHDAAYAGHVGITKTLERLSRVFYWDTMRADVRHYVTTCDACQRDKSSTLKPGGLLNPLSIPDYRWESVSMDLITKLPSASHGFDAICVFVDRLSKMVHFVPCKESMNAKGFARLFVDNVFKLHGLPKDMVSDRGPHFHNTFWHHVQKLLGMRVSLSSSYHPQSDGQTERYNRVLEEMLRHYISPTQADWPDYLSLAEFAVNNSWQESIKSTPFLVNTGQSPITPMLHSLPDKGRCPEGLSYATWWQEAVAKAKLCMQAAQQRQAAYANQDRRDVHYKVGQMVLLSTKNMRLKPGKARKLLPRFVGPFKVLDLVGQVAVNLQLPASMSRLHPVFHVSLIKPYTGTDVGFMPPPVEWLDEEPVYYVERLLDHRHVHAGKAKEYLVQWEGYDADHNTWEPRSNLVGCDKILAEYNAAHNLKQCESRGFTRGGTEAPLEGEECKVRTSGRDCRFASSGLSRECEPSRDAGYTCSTEVPLPSACTKCAKTPAEGAKFYFRQTRGYYHTQCVVCYNKHTSASHAARCANDEGYRARRTAAQAAYRAANRDKQKMGRVQVATVPAKRLKRIQSDAARRGISVAEGPVETEAMQQKLLEPCYYCNFVPPDRDTINGLDRFDSQLGYSDACCPTCNIMKGDRPAEEFLQNVRRIAMFLVLGEPIAGPRSCLPKVSGWQKGKEDRKDDFLTVDQKVDLWASNCCLCGQSPAFGIDRVDASSPYTPENTRSCCTICNVMKNIWPLPGFLEHIQFIQAHTQHWLLLDDKDLPMLSFGGLRVPVRVTVGGQSLIFPSAKAVLTMTGKRAISRHTKTGKTVKAVEAPVRAYREQRVVLEVARQFILALRSRAYVFEDDGLLLLLELPHAAAQPAASEPGPNTPPPAKCSKGTKAEQAVEPSQPTKGKGKARGMASHAKPPLQSGRWLDRDCSAALNMQHTGEIVPPRKPPQAPRSSQEATLTAASEPGPSTSQPAKRSKRTKAEPEAAEPTKGKGKGKAAKAKPAPQPGRWLDRDCNAALNMQRIGESRWRPLELCFWPDQGALPAKGKGYPGLGYKRLRDKPPKAQQQQQQPAEAQEAGEVSIQMPPKRKRKRPVSPAQSAAGASGSGQQEDEGQGQGEQEVIAERRQVVKAAFRGLVEAAQPDLSPEEVDAVVAQANQRMTMGSMQCCLAADQPPAQPPPGPVPPPQAPPGGRWLDRDTKPCLNFQRIGESMQRPLELCRWTDLKALPPVGKEYQQGYKLVNDRLPKVRQRLHRAAEYRRGIDGWAASAPKRTKAEPEAAEPTKGKGKAQGKAAKAKPAPQPGRWLDRDCNAALNMQRIGESRWRPLELCFWPDQGALPAKGKEYPGLGYKRLRDKPPKAQQQQQQPAGAQYKLLRELELMGASPMPTFPVGPSGPSSLQQNNNIDVHTEVEEGYAGPARAPAGSEQAQRSTTNATSHGYVRVRVPFQVAGRVEVDEMEFVVRDTLILFRSEAVDGGLGGPDPAFCWVTNCVSGPRQRARLEALRDALGWSVQETDEDKRWARPPSRRDAVWSTRHSASAHQVLRVCCAVPRNAGASGSGQQEDEGQGQGEQEVIAERRQVIKAAFRGLVEAAQPDLSPEEVDAVVAQANQRMTMGSMQCCLSAVMSLTKLLQSFLGQPTPGFPAAGPG